MSEQELLQTLDGWLAEHRDQMVRDIIELVNVRSVEGPATPDYPFGEGPARAVDKMMEICARYGYEGVNEDYYTVSFLRPGKTGRELGLLTHLDVVHEGEGWTFAPYDAVEKDGWIIGRGAGDDKGPSIAALYVLRALDDLGVELEHTVRLLCGANEETGMLDVLHYVDHHDTLPECTLVCDAGFPVGIGEKGVLEADLETALDADTALLDFHGGISSNAIPADAYAELALDPAAVAAALEKADAAVTPCEGGARVSCKGVAGHAARPENGVSAIQKLAQVLTDAGLLRGKDREAVRFLAEAFADSEGQGLGIAFEDDISGKTTAVGGYVRLESGKLRQNINVRYAIRADQDKMIADLKATAEKNGFELARVDNNKPRYDPPDDKRVQILLKTARELIDPALEPVVMGGGTHARKFPGGLPYGPGLMRPGEEKPYGGAHAVDEGVKIDDLIRAIRVYVIALVRLSKQL